MKPTGATVVTPPSLIGGAIRRARLDRYLTQEQLAQALTDATGGDIVIDRASISRWESGERFPALRYHPAIVEVLEIPGSFLRSAAA